MDNLTLAEIDELINMTHAKMIEYKGASYDVYDFYKNINKKLIEIWKTKSQSK